MFFRMACIQMLSVFIASTATDSLAQSQAPALKTTLDVRAGDQTDLVRQWLMDDLRKIRDIKIVDGSTVTVANPSTFDISVRVRGMTLGGRQSGAMFSAVLIGPFDTVDLHVLDFATDERALQFACDDLIEKVESKVEELVKLRGDLLKGKLPPGVR